MLVFAIPVCLYIFYFNNEIAVGNHAPHHSVSDEADYKNLPTVYNLEHECILEGDQNIETCTDKVWHVISDLRLAQHIHSQSNMDLHSCYKLCLNVYKSCIAVLRSHGGGMCWLYDKNFHNHPEKGYQSHFLKCCKLQDKGQISKLKFHHAPLVFSNQQSCLSQILKDINYCEFTAFQVIEKRSFNSQPFKITNVRNTFECMNRCLEHLKCIAYEIHIEYEHNMACNLYKTGDVNTNENRNHFVFKKICCKIDEENLWKGKITHNLMMLYQPNKVCAKTTTTTNLGHCKVRIWHVQDELRMKGHYKAIPFDSLNECFKLCIDSTECIGVSIDWTGNRCLFFKDKEFTNYHGQKRWTSYSLECCHGFKDLKSPDVAEFENLPIIKDTEKECLSIVYNNPKSCPDKAWIIADKLRLFRQIKEREIMSLQECFHWCLIVFDCVAILREKESQKCFLFDKNHIREKSDYHESYVLSCCKLKTTGGTSSKIGGKPSTAKEEANEAEEEPADASETEQEASEAAPEASEEAPEEASETAPEASEEAPEASEAAPEASEAAPEASEEAPEAPEEASETAPEASEEAPEASEEAPEASEEAPEASEDE